MTRGNKIIIAGVIGIGAVYLIAKDFIHTPFDEIFDRVGAQFGIPPNLLRAIARKESRFNPGAVADEPNGTKSYGMMQINDITATHFGVSPSALLDAETNVETAARLIRQNIETLGDKASIQALIDSYREGAGGFLKTGINTALDIAYTAEVWSYYQLYTLGALIR